MKIREWELSVLLRITEDADMQEVISDLDFVTDIPFGASHLETEE